MNYIYVLGIGEVSNVDFDRLNIDLKKKFGFEVKKIGAIEMPDFILDKPRNQYDAKKILENINLLDLSRVEKILAITNKDLFSEDLSFIFGQAENPGKNCVVSTFRLNPVMYNEKFNSDLFYDRILKESIHELGHAFGLGHCPDKNCVMYFSNNLTDTDFKQDDFCVKCEKLLKMNK